GDCARVGHGIIASLDRRHQTASFPVVFPIARGSLGGRRQGDDRIVWLGRFQGRGGAFRREGHLAVLRAMTRDTYTTTVTKPRVLDVSYTFEVTRLAIVLLAASINFPRRNSQRIRWCAML